MKLTTKSEYALLALLYMARHQKSGFVRIEDVCRHYDIPQKYLEQLFAILKHNGVVRAKRGAGGGYCFAVPVHKVSVALVIRIMDGALAPTESVLSCSTETESRRAMSIKR